MLAESDLFVYVRYSYCTRREAELTPRPVQTTVHAALYDELFDVLLQYLHAASLQVVD